MAAGGRPRLHLGLVVGALGINERARLVADAACDGAVPVGWRVLREDRVLKGRGREDQRRNRVKGVRRNAR